MGDIINGLLSSAGIPVPLKEIDVSVTISGFVADVQSTLLYINTEESPIEAIFTFPLDDQSAVYKFEADIDGRHLSAECHEKEKAKEIYDDSMAFGRTAVLLQEDDSAGDIFSCKLGNFPTKAEAKICICFATQLDLEPDGKVKFTLPTILNPRYSPDGIPPAGKARYATGNAIPYKLNFHLNVRGPHKIQDILGPQDKINVEYSEAQTVAKVTLAEEFTFDHDLSVLVEYKDCNTPQIVLEKGDPLSGGLLKEDLLMVNFFLEPPAQITTSNPGEFIFIIDRSGSMGGEKMWSAKETLLLFLKSLPVNCYFNVIGFGSNFESLFPEGSMIYNEENLKKAEMLQTQMKADMGGTEILRPLEHVFKQKLIENYPRQLFVLTDGEVKNTNDIIKLAASHSQHTRVFTVGIGQGASTALVRGLAKAGNGKEIFVTGSDRLQPKAISLLRCAMQPVASDVEITWDLPSHVTWIMMPAKIPYIFVGVRQILYLMLSRTDCVDPYCVCSMTLKGKLLSKPFEYKETFTLHDNTETGPSAPIHRLAAKAQIKELQLNDVPKEQIITVSKSANVISKYTAFVMVDNEGKLVEGMSVQKLVPTCTMSSMLGIPRSHAPPRRMTKCASDLPQSSDIVPSRHYMDMSSVACRDSDPPYPVPLRSKEKSQSPPRRMTKCASDLPQSSYIEASSHYMDMSSVACRDSDPPYPVPLRSKEKSQSPPRRMTNCASDLPQSSDIVPSRHYMDMSSVACRDSDPPYPLPPRAMKKPVPRLSRKPPYCEILPPPPPHFRSLPKGVLYSADSGANMTSDCYAPKLSSTQRSPSDRMMDVIRLQTFHGSWGIGTDLLNLLKTREDLLKQSIPLQNDNVVATVAVIAWLRKYHIERRDEWQMLETKALDWLETQDLHGHTVEDLISKIVI
ncbi:hypothetical protein ACJMK2_001091 [Sinanodonta woodiana]|uniref:von Willebrand factor A domain-containing protein 5A-like n=1 Tax=Sinanodonta woodiana TaxID=1069815 RepID=A0ABD3XUN8_SINWO